MTWFLCHTERVLPHGVTCYFHPNFWYNHANHHCMNSPCCNFLALWIVSNREQGMLNSCIGSIAKYRCNCWISFGMQVLSYGLVPVRGVQLAISKCLDSSQQTFLVNFLHHKRIYNNLVIKPYNIVETVVGSFLSSSQYFI